MKIKNYIYINFYLFILCLGYQPYTKYLNQEVTKTKKGINIIVKFLTLKKYKRLKTFLSW